LLVEPRQLVEGGGVLPDSAGGREGAAARQNDVDRAQRALDDAEAAFRRDGGDLYERKLDLERRRQHAVSRLREIDLHLVELAASSMPLRLVSSMVDRLLQTVDEDEKTYAAQVMSKRLEQRDREILALASADVPPVSLKVIERLMSSDRQHLAELATRPPVASLGDSGRARLAFVWPLEVDRAVTEAEKFLAERASVVASIDDLDGSLAAVPSGEAIAQAQTARDVAAANLISALARQELATEALLDVDRRLAAAESDIARRYDEVSGMLAAEADAQRMVLHAGRVRKTLRSYRAALLEKHLSKIEAAVLDSFRQLLRKQNLVSDLRLDPGTFALTLFDRDGQPLPSERLSAGERQLLAVALLWGLARVSGKSLPAVIDTPLGRLDGSHRDLLIERYFPVASHQVILLSTDKEIDPELLRQLEPSIGRRYELTHDEGERTTSVRSGYFWETPNVA
jgi:DNA sulfur modification protein DndD